MRIADYPYVIVRLRCDICHRAGQYRLARLAAKYGPETSMTKVLDLLAADCRYRRRHKHPGKAEASQCYADFPDLRPPGRPPDLPATMMPLRVVQGGKSGTDD